MPEPKDKVLYSIVKKEADLKFKAHGIYKSSWIVSQYKKRGGLYIGTSKDKNKGLLRWYQEKWIDLNRPIILDGKIIGYKPCGRKTASRNAKSNGKYPLCRPTYRITEGTPKTYNELTLKAIKKAKIDKAKIKGKGNIKFKI